MGSKALMLRGVLGSEIARAVVGASRFVDLFAGSGVVARHVASQFEIPVHSVDLMQFSAALSGAVIERTSPLDCGPLWSEWTERVDDRLAVLAELADEARHLSDASSRSSVEQARILCGTEVEGDFIWGSYGGHYFSPIQALELSLYRQTIPDGVAAGVALAALIRTASRASASPGHTAQPFQPTERLLPHIRSAWRFSVGEELENQFKLLSLQFARVRGNAEVGDGVEFAAHKIRDGDVVFCDPPYSDAQYSRFYHVLEGIARGGWDQVQGAGRSPDGTSRVSSDFSRKTQSRSAAFRLLEALASCHATVLWTYPEGERSNGLSIDDIREYAALSFHVSELRIPMRHSTLGGSQHAGALRAGRRDLHEVLLTLRPRQ